jgi:hypothetical protein
MRFEKNNYERIQALLPEIMSKVFAQVVFAYRNDLLDPRPEYVYQEEDKCQQVSEVAHAVLWTYGIPSEFCYVKDRKLFAEYGGKHHVFLKVAGSFLLDGNWQSFINGFDPKNPFLFLRINHLEADLTQAGVPKKLWPIWQSVLIQDNARQLKVA